MRKQAVLTTLLFAAAATAGAQLPLSAPAPVAPEQPSQPLSPALRPPNETFNGSGLVEDMVYAARYAMRPLKRRMLHEPRPARPARPAH